MHDTDPTSLYLPKGQGPEQAEEARAGSSPYFPARQAVQAPALATLYVPGGHATAVAEDEPAGHAYPAVQEMEQLAAEVPPGAVLTFPAALQMKRRGFRCVGACMWGEGTRCTTCMTQTTKREEAFKKGSTGRREEVAETRGS